MPFSDIKFGLVGPSPSPVLQLLVRLLYGALYLVGMDADDCASRYGNGGGTFGTGYSAAPCPLYLKWINGEANVEDWVPSVTDKNAGTGKYGTCWTKIDMWEANEISNAAEMIVVTTARLGSRVCVPRGAAEMIVFRSRLCVARMIATFKPGALVFMISMDLVISLRWIPAHMSLSPRSL